MNDRKIFIVGANGQLGTALRKRYPGASFADIDELDITDKSSVESFDWSEIEVIINAAAYTNVDGAETKDGRILAWKVNADAVANLVTVSARFNIVLVHISTDYVFDGTNNAHTEDEAFSPLSTYGASKAAGDIAVSLAPKFYILRTSWVIGEGKNFVRTMLDIGKKGVNPTVVNDQVGRLTFTTQLVEAINHLLTKSLPYGTYNLTNDGEPASWVEITRAVFKAANIHNSVSEVTTQEYYGEKIGAAQRPLNSIMDLTKIKNTGLSINNWRDDLSEYVKKEMEQ